MSVSGTTKSTRAATTAAHYKTEGDITMKEYRVRTYYHGMDGHIYVWDEIQTQTALHEINDEKLARYIAITMDEHFFELAEEGKPVIKTDVYTRDNYGEWKHIFTQYVDEAAASRCLHF
jgi:hypothetical protein